MRPFNKIKERLAKLKRLYRITSIANQVTDAHDIEHRVEKVNDKVTMEDIFIDGESVRHNLETKARFQNAAARKAIQKRNKKIAKKGGWEKLSLKETLKLHAEEDKARAKALGISLRMRG